MSLPAPTADAVDKPMLFKPDSKPDPKPEDMMALLDPKEGETQLSLQGLCRAMVLGNQTMSVTLTQHLASFGSIVDQKLGQLASGAARRFDQQDAKLVEQDTKLQEQLTATEALKKRMEVMAAAGKYKLEMYGHLELALQLLPFILCLSKHGKVIGWPIEQRNRGLGLLIHVPSWAQMIWLLLRTSPAQCEDGSEDAHPGTEEPKLIRDKMIAKRVRLAMTARDLLKVLSQSITGVASSGLFDELVEAHTVLESGVFGCDVKEKDCTVLNVAEYARFLQYTVAERKWIANPLDIQAAVTGLGPVLQGHWNASTKQGRKNLPLDEDDLLDTLASMPRAHNPDEKNENAYKWTWEPALSTEDLKLNRTKLLATGRLAHPFNYLPKQTPLSPDKYYPVIGHPLPSQYFRHYKGELWMQVSQTLVPLLSPSLQTDGLEVKAWIYPGGGKNPLQHLSGIFATPGLIPTFIGTIMSFKNAHRHHSDHITTAQLTKLLYSHPSDNEEPSEPSDNEDLSERAYDEEDEERAYDEEDEEPSDNEEHSRKRKNPTYLQGRGKCPRSLAALR
jgi:hypothetical protein